MDFHLPRTTTKPTGSSRPQSALPTWDLRPHHHNISEGTAAGESKRLFLGLVALGFSAVLSFTCLAVWAIYPRLSGLHQSLGDAALTAILVFSGAFALCYAMLLWTLSTGRRMRAAEGVDHRLDSLAPLLSGIAGRVGVSPSRVRESLQAIHGAVARAKVASGTTNRVIVVARTVSLSSSDQVRAAALCQEYDVDLHLLRGSDGELERETRAIMARVRPAAVVAVDCGSGIAAAVRAASGHHIPVVIATAVSIRPEAAASCLYLDVATLRHAVSETRACYAFDGAEPIS